MMIGLYYMRLLRCGVSLREPPVPDDNLPPFLTKSLLPPDPPKPK